MIENGIHFAPPPATLTTTAEPTFPTPPLAAPGPEEGYYSGLHWSGYVVRWPQEPKTEEPPFTQETIYYREPSRTETSCEKAKEPSLVYL